MLRRIIAVLTLRGFCCTLAACTDTSPVKKDASSNPVGAAKKSGGEFSGKQIE